MGIALSEKYVNILRRLLSVVLAFPPSQWLAGGQ